MKRIAIALIASATIGSAQTYNESGGLVVMEMENTPSALGLWQQQSSLAGYSGSGYLQFLGNTYESGPANSPLEYTFKINQAGLYYLHLHCAKEIHDGRTDVANDCYVRVEGDYNAGPEPYTSHGDNASLSLLQSDTKYYGGAANSWKWENGLNNLDPGGDTNKRNAVYDFKAGETYKLVVSGRSKFFRINRIVFRHTSTSSSTAENLGTPESDTVGGGSDYVYQATSDFPNTTGGAVPYYSDNTRGALAIDASEVSYRGLFARASLSFGGTAGTYDATITSMRETDGECTYRLLVNGVQVGTSTNTPTATDYELQTHTFPNVTIPAGATIAVESNTHSNGLVSEAGDGNPPWAWARGRWTQLELSTAAGSLVQPPAGRLAIVADGNSPDPDDIGATAVMLGILRGSGLQDRVVHLSHSCDLVPISSIPAADELRRQNKLHALCGEGIGFFGPFGNLPAYFNCRTQQTAAVNDLRDAINASSAGDPLWIIEAGEPDIIGYALQASTASKHQYVHVVSHHPANDNSGDFFTWAQILAFGVTEHQIGDQNVELQTAMSPWDWAENHSNPAMAWIWDQLKYAEQDGVVAFQTNKFDCSDAGMIYWWITGADSGGDNLSTPADMKAMLLAGASVGGSTKDPVAHWKLDEASGTTANDSSGNGYTGTVEGGATWGSDATRPSYVSFDGSNDHISTLFSYALSSTDDFTWAWWANKQSADGTDGGAIMVGNRYPEGTPGENYEFIKLMPAETQFANSETAGPIEHYDYPDMVRNQWHHYAMVKTGTSCQWYVDGVAVGSPVTINYDESSPIPLLIGGDDNGSLKEGEHFEGHIDDVVLYRRALSAADLIGVQNGIYTPTVTLIDLGGPVDSTSGGSWSDGLPAHADADYIIPDTGNLRSETGTSAFPGDTLTVEAGGKFQFRAKEELGELTTVNGLIATGGTSGLPVSLAAGTGQDTTNHLAGTLMNAGFTTLSGHGDATGPRNIRISSLVSGSGTLQSTGSAAYPHSCTIGNSANTFSGTWESHVGTLVFANSGAVGAADISVLDGGKLEIQGNWASGSTLTVVDTSTTEVDLGAYGWTVSSLVFGGANVASGTYDAVALNALGTHPVFTGTGTITVALMETGGPVARWALDEGAGTVASDSSGNGHTGSLLNGAAWGSDATRNAFAVFDGSNDRVSTLFSYSLSSSDDFTWAWWAKQESTNHYSAIMVGNRYPEGTPGENYEFIKFTKQEAQFANTELAASIDKYDYTDLPQDEWHHYAMVKSGTSYQWYVDGVAEGGPVTRSYSEDATIPFLIGGDDDGTGTKVNEHFEGCIDDVVLYDRALAPSEVANLQVGIYGADPNLPVVDAGADQVLTLPASSVGLTGTATDNVAVVSTIWTQQAGPNTATLSGDTTLNLTASGLVFGTYVFRLTATDDESNSAYDEVTVDVTAPAGDAVVTLMLIDADTDQDIGPIIDGETIYLSLLPSTNLNVRADTSPATVGSVVFGLDGNASYQTESIAPYALEGDTAGDYNPWTPSLGAHSITATPYSEASGGGTAGTALTVNFTVEATDPGFPEVEAGPGQLVTLPTDSVSLTGTATDNGMVVSTVWTQQSGPNTATLSGETTLSLTASGLIQGVYVFRLTATDNESYSAYDEVNVNVVPEGGGVALITGELKKWHKVTFSWNGPSTSETAGTNPFSDYRLNVTFSHVGSGKTYTVPGYYAADGNAAETSSQSGDVWRAHFSPDEEGEWTYAASFRSGSDIAIDTASGAGVAGGFFDGDGGSFQIAETDKIGRDLRGKGRLQYVAKHHLRYAETGEYFLKAGADAPENFLAYDDFDDTPNDQDHQANLRKSWSPHAGDYDAATASAFTWQGGKGSEILGAVRYLSQEGLNVFSFLTFNVDGDDDNVFPHRLKSTVAAYEAVADNARWAHANGVHHDRFDVSKMAQWERVFEYGTQMGMYLHFKTQETENDDRMDGGALGRERKLYYRELVARFGHHLALNWNLGEENTNTDTQRKAFAQWFYDNDPYLHNVVLHTYPTAKDTVYTPMLGAASKLTGLSLQTNQEDFSLVFPHTLEWVQNSAAAGVPWVVACDEPGDASHALRPAGDAGDSWTDGRKNALWGNVMAGGAGVEFYFGYQHAHSDLTCQDFSTRDGFWDYCRHMLEFFGSNDVPFQDMSNEDALSSNASSWCLRKPGEAYVVYLKSGGTTNLDLSAASGDFDVRWYDPRNGGVLQTGSVASVTAGSTVSLGSAPSASTSDWVVYVSNGTGGGGTTNGMMLGLASDADIRDDSVIVNLTADDLVPGRSGSSGGLNRATVFVFELPNLGVTDDPFIAATLSFNVESTSTSPPGVDLYGLGRRASADVLAGDYYGETAAPDPTDAVLIQSSILTGSSGTGTRSSSASSALAAYLNAQYDGGDGIGSYVFLRLSTNAPISGLERHFVTSADAVGSNGPQIAYSAVAPQDYDTWLGAFTLPPGADSSPEADPDGDGLDSWTEYLFGLDPSDATSLSPITTGLAKSTGFFGYTRRNPSLTGVTDYQVWVSEDLDNWIRDLGALQTPVDAGAETQQVEVTLTPQTPTPTQLFVRIVVP